MWKKVPRWLLDPLGPLTVRWAYAPLVAPWLLRMLRHSSREEVTRIATALRSLLAPIFDCYDPLLAHADARELVRRSGCLYVFSSRETAGMWAWGMNLRRSLGVRMQDVEQDELESLEPDLKGRFRFGILARQRLHVRPVCPRQGDLQSLHRRRRASRPRSRPRFRASGRARVTAVLLERGEPLAADGVVVAAGAWSWRVGRSARQSGDAGDPARLPRHRAELETWPCATTVMAVEHN